MRVQSLRECAFVYVITAVCCIPVVDACVIVPPPRPPRPIPRPVPTFTMHTHRHEVDIDIRHDRATITVRATFYNPAPRDLEGEYVFPVGEGLVKSFSMTSDGETLEGELIPADTAREIYEDIVRRLRDPGLLEYVGMGLIKVRVFPIKPEAELTIELVYEQSVERSGDSYYLRYPLRSAKPVNASGTIDDILITVRVHDVDPVATLYSPTHEFEFERIDEMSIKGSYEVQNSVPSSDVTLCYIKDRETVSAGLMAFRRAQDEAGFFRLTLSPSAAPVSSRAIPKDVLFIIDTSGSMAGKKMEQALGALRYSLNSLNTKDTYNIITFSSTVRAFHPTVVPLNESNLEHDISRLDDVRARGGTAFYDAVSFSLEHEPVEDRVAMAVLLTDGLPTVGNTDIPSILELVDSRNTGKMRFFVFGVGDDLNTDLLDGLAARSRGTRIYVAESEDIEEKVSLFYERISQPVLTDLHIDFGEIDVFDFYPVQLPDLFAEEDLVLVGRYNADGVSRIRLSGTRGDTRITENFEFEFLQNDQWSFIPRAWAGSKIAYLLDHIRLNGPDDELVEAVTELGREYGIVTPYTSFLAMEDEKDVTVSHHFHESRRVLEREKVGAGAVRASRMMADLQWSMKSTGTAPEMLLQHASDKKGESVLMEIQNRITRRIHRVHDKTFYVNEQGIWVDSRYDENVHGSKIRTIEFLSEEYFRFIHDNPEMGKYLAAHIGMLILPEDEAYLIE